MTQLGFGDVPVVLHDPPLIFDVGSDPAEQFPLDTSDPDIAQVVGEGEVRRLELNTPIAQCLPEQKGSFRKYNLCNQPVFEECFNTSPLGALDL